MFPVFNHDEAANLASAQAPAGLSADVVLPGHGPAYCGSPVGAVADPGRAPLNALPPRSIDVPLLGNRVVCAGCTSVKCLAAASPVVPYLVADA